MRFTKNGAGTLFVNKEDGSFFLFPKAFVKQYSLSEDIDDKEIDIYVAKYAYLYSIRVLATRDHSIFELKTKLKQKGVFSNIIESCIARLLDENALNEKRFAESYVRSKKTYSKNMMKRKLYEKGIDKNIVEEALENYNEEAAAEKLSKKYKDKEKLKIALNNRGFSYSTILKVSED